MIVTFKDFTEEISIPDLQAVIGTQDLVNCAVQNRLQGFIEKYEPVFLYQFYENETDATALETYNDLTVKTDTDLNTLIESLKHPIACFIAFYYFRNETVPNTGIGSILPKGQNSNRTSTIDRSVQIWNEMVEEIRKIYFTEFDTDFYPIQDIFCKINSFNL